MKQKRKEKEIRKARIQSTTFNIWNELGLFLDSKKNELVKKKLHVELDEVVKWMTWGDRRDAQEEEEMCKLQA